MTEPTPSGAERTPSGAEPTASGAEPDPSGAEPGLVSRRPVHQGRIVNLSVDTVRFPDGSTGHLELIRHRGASCVLPILGSLDDADPDVLLVHQYRYAAGGYLYEVPAGIPDSPDESWEACALRELEEETGHRAGTLHPLTRIYTTPGFTDEVIHLFAATDLEPGASRLDRDEFIEVVRLPFSEAVALIGQGRLVDGKSVACILFARTFLLGR